MNFKSYFLLIATMTCCFSASAQLNWKSKGPLYEDKGIAVEIEYALSNDPCAAGQSASQLRYHITRLTAHSDYYINWRFDYFNCDHELKTYVTSLHINRQTTTGYLPGASFWALQLANNFNEVRKSTVLPPVSSYTPTSAIALEPKAITGKLAIMQGEYTNLRLLGGYLPDGYVWHWYEGDCAGRSMGTGSTLNVQPQESTVYAVRGEGPVNTKCIAVKVSVQPRIAPITIDGRSQVCPDEKAILLTVTGGQRTVGDRWVWYQGSCDGTPLGEGNRISVTPKSTTTYFVRLESPTGKSVCQSHQVIVAERSLAADWIDGVEKIDYGQTLSLSVHGGRLAMGAVWVWYAGTGNRQTRVATGPVYTVKSAIASETYAVRAEGDCGNSAFKEKTVRVGDPPHEPRYPTSSKAPHTFFINGGVTASDVQQLSGSKNYVGTVGGGGNLGWYVRGKFSLDDAKAAYESNGVQIMSYAQPGYYQYNGRMTTKRFAYTAGGYVGWPFLAIYLGGGYGRRELLYAIDEYAYGSSYSSQSDWVKHTAGSFEGWEAEGGLLLKLGYFNMMGGAATIQGKYTDFNLGIGLSF